MDGLQKTRTDASATTVHRRAETGGTSRKALTPCEERVVALVAEGHSNKMVARILGKRPDTVKTQLSSALTKLGMRNRTQLAVWAMARQREGASASALASYDVMGPARLRSTGPSS